MADLHSIRDAVEKTEIRLIASSLLITYEADWEKAREGVERLLSERNLDRRAEQCSSWELDGAKDAEMDDINEDVLSDDEDRSSDEEDEDAERLPYVIRLIDFAHTRLAPGQGPDEGVLLGLRTLIKLLGGLIEEVDAVARSSRN